MDNKVKKALEMSLRISEAWLSETNPFNDLSKGESIEYDAAVEFNKTVKEALGGK